MFMRKVLLIILALVAIIAVYFLVTGRANVDQTREGELPNVSAEGGQLPAFDVDVNTAGIERDVEKAGDAIEGAAKDVGNAVEDVDVPRVDVDVDADVNRN
jgi:hypothetical protein